MRCLQEPTQFFSDSVSSRSRLCRSDFSERPLFKALCPSSLWYETESRRAEMCLFSLHFFLFFTPLLPLALITWFVSRTRSFFFFSSVKFYLCRASFAPLSLSLSLSAIVCLLKPSVLIHTGKRENPLCSHFIYTSHTVFQRLLPPALLMFPPLMWSTVAWPHTTDVWEPGLTTQRCRQAPSTEPWTFFDDRSCEDCYLPGCLSLDPVYP